MLGGRRRRGRGRFLPERPFEALDALHHRLQRGPGVPAAEAHQRHLEHEPGVGGVDPPHVDDGLAQRLDDADQRRVAEALTELSQLGLVGCRRAHSHLPGAGREQKGVAGGDEEVLGDPSGLVAGVEELVEGHEGTGGVFVGDRLEHADAARERRRAEQAGDPLRVEAAVGTRDRLVEQRFSVARRAAGGGGDGLERLGVEVDSLAPEQVGEAADEVLGAEQRELEVLGPRPDRRQHLLRVRGRQDEHDVLGRLLDALEQGVRRLLGEHVHLVEDVDGAVPAEALVRELLTEVTGVVDLALRRGVDLEQVEEGAGGDGPAVLALAAGLPVGAEVRAVQGLGQDPGGGGLARAPRPGEQVGVADPSLAHGVAEALGDVLLADQLPEPLRPVLSVERLVGHGRTVSTAGARPVAGASMRGCGPCTRRRPGRRPRGARRRLRPGLPAAPGTVR